MTEREAFEAWDREIFALPDRYYQPLYQGDFPSIDVKARWKAWQAACAWQKRKDEAICAGSSQEAYNRYRASRREYDDGLLRAANALADKIRGVE